MSAFLLGVEMARAITYITTPPIKTKDQEHAEIQKQINDFLKRGGKIKHIPIGVSALSEEETLNKIKRHDSAEAL